MGHFARPGEEDETHGGSGEPELVQQNRRNWGCLEKMEGKQDNLQMGRKKEKKKPFSVSGVGSLCG